MAYTALTAAIDAAESAAVTLASLIKTRDDALNADAPTFSPQLWTEAEKIFNDSAGRLEYGNIRQARELSDEAERMATFLGLTDLRRTEESVAALA